MLSFVGGVRHVFRWDLDKTYLKTEFDTVGDLVRIARLTAEERENIPGSAALLRAIKAAAPDPAANAVYFISGSPTLIRAVIEKKFTLDGFQPDGFTLKPTLREVMRGRFRAVRGQVAYKLAHLLRGRADIPVGTPETLFGDDAEYDAFIYSLYADAVAGTVQTEHVLAVVEASGAYPDQVDAIHEALGSVVHESAVHRIVVHLDQKTEHEVFAPFLPRVVPISNHIQTAIVLVVDGTLPAQAVRLVAQELLGRYRFSADRLLSLSTEILSARAPSAPPEAIEAFAETVSTRPADDGVDEAPELPRLLSEMAAFARKLRPQLPEADSASPPRDYLALWPGEVARVEAQKRRRREEARLAGTHEEGEEDAAAEASVHGTDSEDELKP